MLGEIVRDAERRVREQTLEGADQVLRMGILKGLAGGGPVGGVGDGEDGLDRIGGTLQRRDDGCVGVLGSVDFIIVLDGQFRIVDAACEGNTVVAFAVPADFIVVADNDVM